MKLPSHKAGLMIEHNPHLAFYETVEQYLGGLDPDSFGWESLEDRQLCIRSNDIWIMQWYPDTPIGSYTVAASTLEKVLALAIDVESQENAK